MRDTIAARALLVFVTSRCDFGRRSLVGVGPVDHRHVQHKHVHSVLFADLHLLGGRLGVLDPFVPQAHAVAAPVALALPDVAR